ncbi:hypothetical protein OG21DRAFT_1420506 [Imleria badia]|nr:hypothetical protein OG21DRAFT_1420506 [Imleria badia]
MRGILQGASFKAIVKIKKPPLSAIYRKRRLVFALKYQYWTVGGYLAKQDQK